MDGGMVNMDDGMMHDMHDMDGGHDMHDMDGGHDMHDADGMDMDMAGMDMHSMHAMGNSSMNMHMMMMMYFHFSQNIPHLLFESWNISAIGELIGSVVFTLVLAVLYEGLKTFREYLMCVGLQSGQRKNRDEKLRLPEKNGDIDSKSPSCQTSDTEPEEHGRWHTLKHHSISMTMHIIQSLLHVIQVGVAYILMLIAMTYNAWLFFAVIFGSGLGYFIFSKVRHLSSPFRESQDHCH